ncbi:hypothetical protein SCYAM73S_08657 [Streptomyces cyaneofuscatus]
MQTARTVPAATVVNLRDLGGIALGRDRRVRQGVLFRSGQLSDLDPGRDRAVAALGIRTVVDLRTADERQWSPDRLPDRARLFVADVLGDHPGVAPARLKALLTDPAEAERALGGGRAEELFAETYRKMVLSPGAAAAYRAFLETAADPAARPVLFHCTAARTAPAGGGRPADAPGGLPADRRYAASLSHSGQPLSVRARRSNHRAACRSPRPTNGRSCVRGLPECSVCGARSVQTRRMRSGVTPPGEVRTARTP